MRSLFIIYLSLISLCLSGQTCDSLLFSEPFGAAAPSGWTGDFSMGLDEGWLTKSGPTTTPNTGPEGASEGDYYIYCETSGPAPVNATYKIQSTTIEIPADGSVNVSFAYLMYGAEIGSLNVEVLNGVDTDTIFRREGQQHSNGTLASWETVNLDLSAYAGSSIRLQLSAMKMVTGLGDVAIDDIKVCYTAPIVSTVPTLGEWGILVLFLCMAIFGVQSLSIRNRKASYIA